MSNTIQWLHGFTAKLTAPLKASDGMIQISKKNELFPKLANGYSYLTLSDGVETEIVKIEQFGDELKITRGQEGTEPKTFPVGTCVKWEVTKSSVLSITQEVEKNKTMEDCDCKE